MSRDPLAEYKKWKREKFVASLFAFIVFGSSIWFHSSILAYILKAHLEVCGEQVDCVSIASQISTLSFSLIVASIGYAIGAFFLFKAVFYGDG